MATIIFTTTFESPLGKLVAASTDIGICMLEFCDDSNSESKFNELTKVLSAEIICKENSHIKQLKKELQDYFAGNLFSFNVPLQLVGTDFQKNVWNELLSIPFGTTRTYKQQSIALNNLLSIRAVANANGLNRIAIVVPCHRVIGTNGKLTGYSGGLWRKQWLLNFEMEHSKVNHSHDLFSAN